MQRKHYSADFKVKIALEVIKGLKTVNEIASELGVHPTQIAQWKKQALEVLPVPSRLEKAKSASGLAAFVNVILAYGIAYLVDEWMIFDNSESTLVAEQELGQNQVIYTNDICSQVTR